MVGTGVTLPVFNYLSPVSRLKEDLVAQNRASWNQIANSLQLLGALRQAAHGCPT